MWEGGIDEMMVLIMLMRYITDGHCLSNSNQMYPEILIQYFNPFTICQYLLRNSEYTKSPAHNKQHPL